MFFCVWSRWGPTFQDWARCLMTEWPGNPLVITWWAGLVTTGGHISHQPLTSWQADEREEVWRYEGGNALDVGFLLVCAKSRMDRWTVQHHTCVLTCVLSLNIVSLWHARMNVCGPCSALAHSSRGLTSPARPSPDMVVVIIKTEPSPLRNFSVSDTYWAGPCFACRIQFIYCEARSSLIVSSHAFINRSWKLHRVLPYLEAWELGQVHH